MTLNGQFSTPELAWLSIVAGLNLQLPLISSRWTQVVLVASLQQTPAESRIQNAALDTRGKR